MTHAESLVLIIELVRRVRELEADLQACQQQRDRLLDATLAKQRAA